MSSVAWYHSFDGEVEASTTPTICRLLDLHRHQLSTIARAGAVFRCASQPDYGLEEPAAGGGDGGVWPAGVRQEPAVDVKTLHAKIGELTLENDFLEGALSKAGMLSAKR